MSDVQVSHNPEESRYEARLDGELAGYADYKIDGDRIVFDHTKVEDRFEGRGVGSARARGALDDVRAKGQHRVVPECPFIKAWIDKHPDYADLVVTA